MKARVILHTDEKNKVTEFGKCFSLYDINVIQDLTPVPKSQIMQDLLDKDPKLLAFIQESTHLYKADTEEVCDFIDLELVDHHSVLDVYTLSNGKVVKKRYRHITKGYLDFALRCQDGNRVFGWDDVFVVKETHTSYHELKEKGLKVSSRDMTISQFIEDHIHYKVPLNMYYYPQKAKEVIDFELSVKDFMKSNSYIQNPVVNDIGFNHLFDKVLDSGVFFRSAVNRRQKNYWLPGLNAGVPLTRKKDPIHETTFIVHDFCHFLIPDLIYTGANSKQHKTAYILYRMMSEASTLVLADMLFVDCLQRSGIEYNYAKRCIYPLFSDLGLDFSDKSKFRDNLKTLVKANAAYCLKGDDSEYKRLLALGDKTHDSLDLFKGKYHAFFCEDYRWTQRNWVCMSSKQDKFKSWWEFVSPLAKIYQLDIQTIDDFLSINSLDLSNEEETINTVVNHVIDKQIMTFFEPSVEHPYSSKTKAFIRYMMGQFLIFEYFDFVESSQIYKNKIMEVLCSPQFDGSSEMIKSIRCFYQDFLKELLSKNIISKDDCNTYSDVFPLFDPYFVFYDEDKEYYPELKSIYKEILFK
ncbi:hypothetical protein MHO82_15380 [Vibrio sp. Of7-15]|uniref:hypothetical protein n=1 Tax=Vibrio sp. Of7-15 TaxID=2724879 RepID=UPI001EF35A90|nr:hypothetical protein [Vibrio sp. Of7-15]MCG7498249.1 hypothetical protein [Vibrio sp. Of7-15]